MFCSTCNVSIHPVEDIIMFEAVENAANFIHAFGTPR
jgi:hypothetical protein